MGAAMFALSIRLQNDAMKTPADLAEALRVTADRVEDGWDGSLTRVLDANGDRCGFWQVTK